MNDMKQVFIDGQVGTTGLQIFDRLKSRDDIELVTIPDVDRKDVSAKKNVLNEVDLVILCLPDSAAIESVSLIENPQVKILDASTAHRIEKGWVYGLPELNPGQREEIRNSKKVANPGCYPTGFLLGIKPLQMAGLISDDYPLAVHAVSGYSGGGRQLIEKYQQAGKSDGSWSFRPYSLMNLHKHVPEMKQYSGLSRSPIFAPAVADVEQGMLVTIPLNPELLMKEVDADKVHGILSDYYRNETFVRVQKANDADLLESGFINMTACNNTNFVDLFVFGQEGQLFVIARLDNLGKGASGAAVQNLNIMIGAPENSGLEG
ncbi:MAG: N-acetyl-gamma-glutamyl-phosphate reductase [Proteobacteria bacterium]|nr:N-acetyl-gamma-glutamyl-phosphate reductase [Pseudomonadota bacterium]